VLPRLWSLDAITRILLQPLSGACVLLLMIGWPLTVLLLVPLTEVMVMMADLGWLEALQLMAQGSRLDPNWVPAPLVHGDDARPLTVAVFKHHAADDVDPSVREAAHGRPTRDGALP
jgi:hypothetical protein